MDSFCGCAWLFEVCTGTVEWRPKMTDAAVAVAVAPLVVGAVDVDAASRVWTG